MLNKLSQKVCTAIASNKRFLCARRRKYPINPEETKSLPVFDYGASQESYRRVFVWGSVQTGALGVPYMRNNENVLKCDYVHTPRRLGFAEKFRVSTAACGFGFTAFAIDGGETGDKLYGTGLNTDSQIGKHVIRKDHPLEIIYFPQLIHLPLENPTTTKITKLAAGRAHLVVLTDEGVFCLGNNSYGQCARAVEPDENYLHSNFINHVPEIEGKKVTDVECGQDHTVAITEDGAVYSCGWGADGQTGLGTYDTVGEFTRARGDIEDENIVKVSSRSDVTLALNDKGQVFGWGNAEYKQIRSGKNVQQVCRPTYMDNLRAVEEIVDVGAGGSFCLALNRDGEVFSWGFGLLGAGPKVQHSAAPIKLRRTLFGHSDFQPDCRVEQVVCGLSHAVAVTNLGDVYTWGRNRGSCLGLRHDKDQYFPLKVSLGGYVSRVFCGLDHTVAICKPFI